MSYEELVMRNYCLLLSLLHQNVTRADVTCPESRCQQKKSMSRNTSPNDTHGQPDNSTYPYQYRNVGYSLGTDESPGSILRVESGVVFQTE